MKWKVVNNILLRHLTFKQDMNDIIPFSYITAVGFPRIPILACTGPEKLKMSSNNFISRPELAPRNLFQKYKIFNE